MDVQEPSLKIAAFDLLFLLGASWQGLLIQGSQAVEGGRNRRTICGSNILESGKRGGFWHPRGA